MPTILRGKDDTTAGGGAVVVSDTASTAVVTLISPRSFCASVVNFGMYFLNFKTVFLIFLKVNLKKTSDLVGLTQELCFFVFSQ